MKRNGCFQQKMIENQKVTGGQMLDEKIREKKKE